MNITEPAAVVEPIEFTCTQTDFLDALRLHHALSLRGRRFLVRMAATAAGLGIAFIIGVQSIAPKAIEYGVAVGILFLCVIAILTLLNRLAFLPRASRRQFLQQKEFRGAIKVAVISPRIALTSKNGFSETLTEDFLKWAENRKSILLYRSDRLFNFIPKRVVSDVFHRSLITELTRAGIPEAGFSNS